MRIFALLPPQMVAEPLMVACGNVRTLMLAAPLNPVEALQLASLSVATVKLADDPGFTVTVCWLFNPLKDWPFESVPLHGPEPVS